MTSDGKPDVASPVERGLELAFLFVYGIVKYLPSPFADVLRFGVARLFNPRIRSLWIHEGVTLRNLRNIAIGPGTALNEFVFINGWGGVTIGRDVAVGAGCRFASFEHDYLDSTEPMVRLPIERRPIVVEDGVYFGYGATILGGVRIGTNAVVGAGSVVVRDVPPNAIVLGVPARVVGLRGSPG